MGNSPSAPPVISGPSAPTAAPPPPHRHHGRIAVEARAGSQLMVHRAVHPGADGGGSVAKKPHVAFFPKEFTA